MKCEYVCEMSLVAKAILSFIMTAPKPNYRDKVWLQLLVTCGFENTYIDMPLNVKLCLHYLCTLFSMSISSLTWKQHYSSFLSFNWEIKYWKFLLTFQSNCFLEIVL